MSEIKEVVSQNKLNYSKANRIYVYDIETYPNLFLLVAIPIDIPKEEISKYILLDIEYINTDDISKKEDLWNQKKQLLESNGMVVIVAYDSKDYSIYNKQTFNNFFYHRRILYGYNSNNFDSYLVDNLMLVNDDYDTKAHRIKTMGRSSNNSDSLTEYLYKEAMLYIEYGRFYKYNNGNPIRKFYRTFSDRDLQKILYLDKSFTSLKQVAINLRWHRIQELPIPAGSKISKDDIKIVLDYCINDVLITHKLYWDNIEEIQLRDEITNMYGINFTNDSRSSIGNKLAIHYYSEITGLHPRTFTDINTIRYVVPIKDILSDKIKFKTPFFNSILNYLKDKNIAVAEDETDAMRGGTTKLKPVSLEGGVIYVPLDIKDNYFRKLEFNISKVRIVIATGGIHSKDDDRVYKGNDSKCIIDLDITSMYPSIILIYDVNPEHLIRGVFPKMVGGFKDDRVKAKRNGEKVKSEALKIVINRIYGSLNNKDDMNRDAQAMYKVTINGQIAMLKLIEDLNLANIDIISVNTDGIVCVVERDKKDVYDNVCSKWMNETGFELEFTEYTKYIRKDVNNYIAIKPDTTVKLKGIFDTKIPATKGFTHPIVTIALNNYFIKNRDYRDTIYKNIKEHKNNIYNYCISQKVDRKFDVIYVTKHGTTQLQHSNRFYVCKANKGGRLYKVSDGKQISITTEEVILFNNYYDSDDYNIDFGFYVRKVEEVLYGAIGKKKENGIIGSMNELF